MFLYFVNLLVYLYLIKLSLSVLGDKLYLFVTFYKLQSYMHHCYTYVYSFYIYVHHYFSCKRHLKSVLLTLTLPGIVA